MATIDLTALEQLRARVESIAAGPGRADMMESLRSRAHDLTLECFNSETDPYGRPWERRKAPPDWAIRAFGLMQGAHKLLDDSGAGINSLTSRASGTSIFMRMGKDYMGFHLRGTRFMVPRKFWPVDGLPDSWARDFSETAERSARNTIGAQ